tara:strand:+ start:1049 stop:1567 length:519 start_codon:yes stop_codon:yes gene_type:complete
MRIKILPLFLVISFLFIFFIFFKGLQNSNIYSPDINNEKDIPFFETKILNTNDKVNSKEIFISDKFYLLNVWASWCIPCKDEHPYLMDLSVQNNIEIIGLNYKDNDKNAKNFLKKMDNPYKVIFLDKDGTIAIEWGAYGVPESFLIYNKRVIKKIIGPLNKNSYSEIINLIK